MNATKEKKKATRRVFGRIAWIDIGVRRFSFELTKAGLVVHQKCARRKDALVLPFEALTGGAGHEWQDGSVTVRFSLTAAGLEVRRGGSKVVRTLDYAKLTNLTRPQPLLQFEVRLEDAGKEPLKLEGKP